MDELILSVKQCMGTVAVLYFKTHGFHFNVEGIHFHSLHKFFEEQYEALWESLDDFGEQVRQLDAYSPSTMHRMNELSMIAEQPHVPEPLDMVQELAEGHEVVVGILTTTFQLATKANKQGLANFIADRIEYHSKTLWMLKATAKQLS